MPGKFVVDPLLEGIGLRRSVKPRSWPIWTREEKECTPFFSPSVIARYGGVQLLGVVGVMVIPFEERWQSLLDEHGFAKNFQDTILISSYLTSIPAFQRPPLFAPGADVDALNGEQFGWIEAIGRLLANSPCSLKELEECFSRREIHGVELSRFYGHPVKWKFFAGWAYELGLRAVAGVATERKVHRTHPYDALAGQPARGLRDSDR